MVACGVYITTKNKITDMTLESKVKVKYIKIKSPQTPERLSLHFDKMFSSVRGCAKHIAQSCKLKAKVTVEGNGIEH